MFLRKLFGCTTAGLVKSMGWVRSRMGRVGGEEEEGTGLAM